MGTPNTYYFDCPNCGKETFIQVQGDCTSKKINEVCSCEAEAIMGVINSSCSVFGGGVVCEGCGFKVSLAKKYAMKRSSYITPVIVEIK